MKCPKCNSDIGDESRFCKECGTNISSVKESQPTFTKTLETPTEDLTTGFTFAGRYQIIEELGKGGMGKVYRALDKKLHEEVALKLIKPDISSDKKTIERFKNELRLARKIRQKNVGSMYELLEEKGIHFITMEYISGQDLKGLIRQTGQLTVGKAISITKQICDGLTEAHSLGVVHRDLKPNNIMIDRGGNAKIMDFGIARAVKGKSITGSGVMIGTPQYMSPEQVEGKDVDLRSDIYSLGIVLYEMLTDHVPFEGDTPLTIGVKQKTETPKDPKLLNERIPDDLNRLILKCLEKEKENRYQSTDELRSDLDKLELGLPTTDRDIPKSKPLTSREFTVQLNMKKLLIPALAVFAVVVIGLILWSPWSKRTSVPLSSDKPSLAVLFFRNGSGDPNLEIWKENICDYIITDLSQSKYIRVFDFTQIVGSLEQHNLLGLNRYSDEDLRSISVALDATHILTGSFSTPGESFRIDYSLYNFKKGDGIASDRAEGDGVESIPSLVDELTKKIKADFNLTSEEITSDFDKEIGAITTPNPEAYRCYREGRKIFVRGDQMESIPLMQKAISIDPEFAMAYRSIGITYHNNSYYEQAKKFLQKAFELSDKVSYKEKLYIQGNYFEHVEINEEKAIDVYKMILEEYPEDSFANAYLGVIYINRQDWNLVIKHFKICVENKGEFSGYYSHLGTAYEAKGMYEKAREAFRDYIDNFGENVIFQRRITNSYLYEGKYDQAMIEVDKILALNPKSYSKASIYHLQGDFNAAENGYRSWLKDERINWKMEGWLYLEILYRMLGQYEKAKNELRAGLEYAQDNNLNYWQKWFNGSLAHYELAEGNLEGVLARAEFIWDNAIENEEPWWQVGALMWKIQVHLRRDNIAKALELAEEVKKIVDSTPGKNDVRWYLDDLGLIEMKRKNYSEAIELFTQVYKLQGSQMSWIEPHANILNNLASAYYLDGDLEAAQREYENILALTTGRLQYGDLYVKSYYQLGKIHEEQGKESKAIEHYETFLSLWKDADPGLPEVEDARKRLSGLKNK